MTELVTLNAAREAQQLAILAQRPDVAARREQQSSTIQISQAAIEPDVRRAPQRAEAGAQGDSQQDLAKRQDRQDQGLTGPSRARIEIRDYEEASKPALVARPDIVPSGAVALSGSSAALANSLSTSPVVNGQTQAEVDVAIAQQAIQTAVFQTGANLDPNVRNTRLEAAARVVRAAASVGHVNLGPVTADGEAKKYADKDLPSQGLVSGGEVVTDKFYGKGSEAVVGQFSTPDQPQKYSDKAAAVNAGVTFEDSSGESKYYDKVAQTDTGYSGGDPQSEQKSMYDRAQELAAGLGESDVGTAKARKVYSELNVYGPPAGTPAPSPSTLGQPVTVQVTA